VIEDFRLKIDIKRWIKWSQLDWLGTPDATYVSERNDIMRISINCYSKSTVVNRKFSI